MRVAGALAALLAAAGAPAGPWADAAQAGPTQTTLQRFAAANPGTGALIWRLDEGEPVVVASVRPDVPRIPASNMKLVTAAGALLQMGTDYRYTTRLATTARARIVGGELRGPLYLMGAGDPLLATRAYAARHLPDTATPLGDLVRPLRAAGVRRVRGPVVADESLFDERREGDRWLSHYHLYSQPLGALSVNQSYAGNRRGGDESRSPARTAGLRLRAALRGVHIPQRGGVRTGITPRNVRVLTGVRSAPLPAVVREMNVPSDNFVAEMVLKSIGVHGLGQGTSAAGADRTAQLLEARGILTGRERLVDGSGLSRANRLTPTALVRLIAAADADPDWGRALISSLPRGGQGTLANRFRPKALARRVRAKTGFINGASGLSGRAVSRGGHRYAFSLLMNTERTSQARAVQDRVVALLVAGHEDPDRD
ncbi:MAG: D-alanyl-D-alanine carboxypeptidase/D-alanyl-D-alanine-endopeptidase [Miltoncostaeaceae bacterium]